MEILIKHFLLQSKFKMIESQIINEFQDNILFDFECYFFKYEHYILRHQI